MTQRGRGLEWGGVSPQGGGIARQKVHNLLHFSSLSCRVEAAVSSDNEPLLHRLGPEPQRAALPNAARSSHPLPPDSSADLSCNCRGSCGTEWHISGSLVLHKSDAV